MQRIGEPSTERPGPGFTQRVLIVGAVALLVLAVVFLFQQAIDLLLLVFAGILLAVFLNAISGWIHKWLPIGYRPAVLVTVVLLLALLAGFIVLAAPGLSSQAQQLGENLVAAFENVETTVANTPWVNQLLQQAPSMQQFITNPQGLVDQAQMLFSTTFSMITNAVIILFIGFYLAWEPELYTGGLVRLAPVSRRPRMAEWLGVLGYTLKWWLVGRLASMAIVGVLSVVGLLLLGVPLAFILGVLAGLLAFIPLLGPALALVPAVLVGLTQSPQQALFVFLLYMGIQFIESYILTPIIQRQAVRLPPVLLIMSQVLFGLLAGLLGIAMAGPIAAAGMVTVKMLYVEDVLHDHDVDLLADPDDVALAAPERDGGSKDKKKEGSTNGSTTETPYERER